ncbi:MAG: hypothetical protein HKN47_24260 [Pirellulaceae bacterium]|nr:hypothetical protein [Pirellulaceae bacterium]
MSNKLNPYQSPRSVDAVDSWWTRLRRRLFRIRVDRPPVFANGEAIICHGLAFFIDPDNASVLYAASPSSVHTPQRMNLVVAEAIRVLPTFLADHPKLHAQLRSRKLIVRLIDSYECKQSEYQREVALEWDILDAVLRDAPLDEALDVT